MNGINPSLPYGRASAPETPGDCEQSGYRGGERRKISLSGFTRVRLAAASRAGRARHFEFAGGTRAPP